MLTQNTPSIAYATRYAAMVVPFFQHPATRIFILAIQSLNYTHRLNTETNTNHSSTTSSNPEFLLTEVISLKLLKGVDKAYQGINY